MQDWAGRARRLVGTRFRAQGRSVETGLDCIGVALQVFNVPSEMVRRDYRLRGDHRTEILRALKPGFRRVAPACRKPGDLLLLSVRPDQMHLAVATPGGFVHADAGIGRVVETPGDPKWPIAGVFRRRKIKLKGR